MNVASNYVMLSIQSEHAEKIYSGEKRAELRKSFTGHAKIVFLYETAPVSAITGAFLVREATRTNVEEAIGIAEKNGVRRDRAADYYGQRDVVWVITVSRAIKFGMPIPISDLRKRDHYFSVPQTFAYLSKYEGLSCDLMQVFKVSIERELALREISDGNVDILKSLISSEIGKNYEDIDDGFLSQVVDSDSGSRAAFSTLRKSVLEYVWCDELIGFSVVTQKTHGAWKTGPSVLLPLYRGVGFGQELRRLVEEYCRRGGARAIYCTCSDAQPLVVSYLLNSGLSLQSRLKGHLSRNRDELVFSKSFLGLRRKTICFRKAVDSDRLKKIARVFSSDERAPRVVKFFLKNMSRWYFEPPHELGASIFESLRSFESGQHSYAFKSRAIYAGFDSSYRVCSAALLTPKRSGMVKINLVAVVKDYSSVRRLIEKVLEDFSHYRRFYLTVPVNEIGAIEALVSVGFDFEGVLTDPFGNGVDHVCLGRIEERISLKS